MPYTIERIENYGDKDDPAYGAIEITPDDGTDLSKPIRGLYIGVGGEVTLITAGSETVRFIGLVAGTILPVRSTRVLASGTTATDLVGLY